MSNILTAIQIALTTMRKNKSRVGLTMFGIVIGISMVIIVLSAGAGVKGLVLGQLSSFGNDWVNIDVKIPSTGKNSGQNANGQARGVTITTLTYEDAQAVKKIQNVAAAYAAVTNQATIAYGNETERPIIFGVTADYPSIDTGKIAAGRFFTEDEERGAAEVIVLGSAVAESLFGNDDANERFVTVNKKSYRVIGVMEERGVTGFFNFDETVYIPLRTVQKKIMNINHVLWITTKVKDNTQSESTAAEIRSVLRERHDITDPDKDDFGVTTMTESIAIVDTVFTGITWLLIALAAISLLVGGVGIMNVMYVSVVERTFEIGLRKAAGATRKHILTQFLTEAVGITFVGGILGMIIGIAISFLISVIAQALDFDWKFYVSPFSVLLAVGFSSGVGILFGLYPARKAAALDPMVAIRQE